MPKYRFVWRHDDLPKALKEGYKATASGASKDHVEGRLAAAEASGGIAFMGTTAAESEDEARAALTAQAHARYQAYATNAEADGTERPDYESRVAISPEDMTLDVEEVKT